MERAVRRLRSKIAATETDAKGHRRYAAELREEIVGFARARISDGATQTSIATELGLGARLLWRWLKRDDTPLREVVLEASELPAPAIARRLVLRSGVEIHGLEVDELIAIARALS